MKQELVEKVAEQIRDTVNRAGDEYPTVAIARYALALAERAARAGIAATRLCHESLAMAQTKLGEDAFAEEAVERAVEGA
jgi:hypothetical protein